MSSLCFSWSTMDDIWRAYYSGSMISREAATSGQSRCISDVKDVPNNFEFSEAEQLALTVDGGRNKGESGGFDRSCKQVENTGDLRLSSHRSFHCYFSLRFYSRQIDVVPTRGLVCFFSSVSCFVTAFSNRSVFRGRSPFATLSTLT
jgi:hypothetical protein